MKRIIYTGAALAALTFGGVAVAASPAMAASGPQQYVTHSNGHVDTTSGVNTAVTSDGGPVWAYDNITVKLTPVQIADPGDGANYRVTVETLGSFHGFADPTTGAPLDSTGPVKGTISYDVYATQAPDGAGLPSQEPGGLNGPHLTDMIKALFDGNASIVGGGDQYTFSYQNGAYAQYGAPLNTTVGDVTGH